MLRDCRPSQDSRMQVGREISGPSLDAAHLLGTMSACPTRKKVQTPAVCWKFAVWSTFLGSPGCQYCPVSLSPAPDPGTGCGHPEASTRSGLGNSLAQHLGTHWARNWDLCPVLEIDLGHSEFPWGWGRKRSKRGPAIVTQSPGGSGGPSLERRLGAGGKTLRVAASSGKKWPWRLSVPCPHRNS